MSSKRKRRLATQTTPMIISKQSCGNKKETLAQYYLTEEFQDDIYQQNMNAFMTVNRFLRKKLKRHRACGGRVSADLSLCLRLYFLALK